jgi:hypothetical protein
MIVQLLKRGRFAMSFLNKLFNRKNNPDSYAFRLARAKSLHGQVVKYVTERRNDNDDVIGRGGALALHGETFIVDSSGERVFACNVKDLEASNLMSGDGVVIKGPDLLSDGKIRTVTVHFVYHRK